MLHEISDLTKKISVMYDKALILHRMRYDLPKDKQDPILIKTLIEDIQALAGDIYNDRGSPDNG